MGTVLGARLHSSPGFPGGEGSSLPGYPEYGWPWGWKTNAPGWIIHNMQDDHYYPYNEDGYAPSVFLVTTAMWFVAALAAEGLLWLLVHYIRRLWDKIAGLLTRSSPSVDFPP